MSMLKSWRVVVGFISMHILLLIGVMVGIWLVYGKSFSSSMMIKNAPDEVQLDKHGIVEFHFDDKIEGLSKEATGETSRFEVSRPFSEDVIQHAKENWLKSWKQQGKRHE